MKKFIQPQEGIEVVSRYKGTRTLLTEEALQKGRERVANGESIDDVARDLAIEEAMLLLDSLDSE